MMGFAKFEGPVPCEAFEGGLGRGVEGEGLTGNAGESRGAIQSVGIEAKRRLGVADIRERIAPVHWRVKGEGRRREE